LNALAIGFGKSSSVTCCVTNAGDLPISLAISDFFLPFASSRPMKSAISRAVSSLRCRFSITWSA